MTRPARCAYDLPSDWSAAVDAWGCWLSLAGLSPATLQRLGQPFREGSAFPGSVEVSGLAWRDGVRGDGVRLDGAFPRGDGVAWRPIRAHVPVRLK
ncbi:MAG: hypothetical protein JWQ86_4192 [Mycobacterium sp.]|nr:hypothetical protein [Mycobacterium sp.]